jgi:hypothetical protein
VSHLRARVARLERRAAALRRVDPLDVVDVLTLMQLATAAQADASATWHRHRQQMGVEDDGTGEGRVAAIRSLAEANADV